MGSLFSWVRALKRAGFRLLLLLLLLRPAWEWAVPFGKRLVELALLAVLLGLAALREEWPLESSA